MEFARARTACAVVARGLVCERMGNNFFTSVLPFAMRVVVVVVVVASRTRAVSRRHSRVSRARARGRAHRRARSRRSRAERGGGLRGKHGRRRGHLGVRSTRARRRVRGRARGTAPGGGGRVEWRLARWCGMVWSMSHDPSRVPRWRQTRGTSRASSRRGVGGRWRRWTSESTVRATTGGDVNAFDSRRARCVTRAAVDSTGRLTGWASLLDVFEIAKRSCCACTRSRR